MAWYYWCNHGRLGNLLMQFAAIENMIDTGDVVLCFNDRMFDALHTKGRYVRLPHLRYLVPNFNHYTNKLFDYLASRSLLSRIVPQTYLYDCGDEHECANLLRTEGFVKHFTVIKGYFQHDKWLQNAFKFKYDKYDRASARLMRLSPSRCRVAVHVRLNDYMEWVVLGKKDVSISRQWYDMAIEHASAVLDNPEFIFFTDDVDGLKKYGFTMDLRIYGGVDAIEELIAISLCEHAIISPSTFAYSAVMSTYYPDKLVIAPKYWAGYKSGVWFPPTIESSKIHYIEVP